jgi:hypothetical protein
VRSLAFRGQLRFERHEGAIEQRQRPLAIEEHVGRQCIRVGNRQPRRAVSASLKRFVGRAGAALLPQLVIPSIAEKVFHRAEQERAEPSPLGIGSANAASFEQTLEEFVRQFARCVLVPAFAPQEGEDRRIVSRAQIAQGRASFGRLAARLEDA